MSILSLVAGDCIDSDAGRRSLAPLLAIGIASVVYWRATGDLRFYAIVQFYPMLIVPLLLVFRTPRQLNRTGYIAMIGFYALAKMFELFDSRLSEYIATGGHPWKHISSALGLFCFIASFYSDHSPERRTAWVY